jgi:hypothetical protein
MRPSSCCTTRPFIGVVGALLGSIISTLDRRITTFGLADVRGAVHAGFDEGGAARRYHPVASHGGRRVRLPQDLIPLPDQNDFAM